MPIVREPRELSDGELLCHCGAGDARAWRELVRRYSGLVLGVPRAMGLQAADVDEVFQLTFSALFRALPRLREPERVEAWLVTASRRAALRLLRDRRRHDRLAQRHLGETVAQLAPPADEALERLTERERVGRALHSLTDPCRALLTALFADRRSSYRELAAQFGVAVGSLGAQRARCLERLRRRLLRVSPPRPAARGASRGTPVRRS